MKYNVTVSVDCLTSDEADNVLSAILNTRLFRGNNTGYVTLDITEDFMEVKQPHAG